MTAQVIAIDGPAASGKSTVARACARALSWLYVDSGALYRGMTWSLLEQGIEAGDTAAVRTGLPAVEASFFVADGAVRFRMNGRLLVDELREERINRAVSPVSAVPEVRVRIVEWLRSMCAFGNLVMEGRDIGTKVFPHTPWKFYLDASPEERARRRHVELQQQADGMTVDAVNRSLKRRDKIDSGRAVDPLRVADDATVIDSTGLGIAAVVALIIDQVEGFEPGPRAAADRQSS